MGIEKTLQEEGRRKNKSMKSWVKRKPFRKEDRKKGRKKQGEKNKQTNGKANWKLKKLKESSSSILFLTFKCEK